MSRLPLRGLAKGQRGRPSAAFLAPRPPEGPFPSSVMNSRTAKLVRSRPMVGALPLQHQRVSPATRLPFPGSLQPFSVTFWPDLGVRPNNTQHL